MPRAGTVAGKGAKRQRYTAAQKMEMLRALDGTGGRRKLQTEVAHDFRVPKSVVSRIVKNRKRIEKSFFAQGDAQKKKAIHSGGLV